MADFADDSFGPIEDEDDWFAGVIKQSSDSRWILSNDQFVQGRGNRLEGPAVGGFQNVDHG